MCDKIQNIIIFLKGNIMKIKWNNIILLLLIIFFIFLLCKLSPILEALAEDFRYSYRSGDPVIGILSLGLICITIVCVAVVLSRK